jgi:titin
MTKKKEILNHCHQDIITDPQLPKSFRSGTESIQRLEEHRWRREEMIEDSLEAKPPKFITSIKDVQVIEGQPAHFDCRVEPIGDGSMKIEWFHDGKPIQVTILQKLFLSFFY